MEEQTGSKLGKAVYCHPAYLTYKHSAIYLYVEYIMRNTGLDEAQSGVKTAERNSNINKVRDFIFLGSKITAGGDCSHEIQRCLLLGRKAMTNLDSILKSRDMTLPTKFHLVKAMVFPLSCMDVKVGL